MKNHSNLISQLMECQSSKLTISLKPKTSENSFWLLKISDGLVEFKHDYRETSIWNSVLG